MEYFKFIFITSFLFLATLIGYGQNIVKKDRLVLNQSLNIEEKIDKYNNTAEQLMTTHIDSAWNISIMALQYSISAGYLAGETEALLNKSYIERLKGSLDSARINLKLAQKKAIASNNSLLLANTYIQTGILYEDQAIYDIAFENYTDALHLYEQLFDTTKLIITLNFIGGVQIMTDDVESAIVSYLKARHFAELINDTKSMALTTNNLANTFSMKKRWNESMEMYKKALEVNIKGGHLQWSVINYQNIASVFEELNQLDSSMFYLQHALHLSNKFNDSFVIAELMTQLGVLYLKRGEITNANKYLSKADSIAVIFNMTEVLVTIKSSFADLYRQTGNYEKESNYLREYVIQRDVLQSAKDTSQLAELKFKYNFENEQKELELQVQRSKYLSIIIVIFSLSGFIILILLFIQQKTRGRKAKISRDKTFLKNENLKQSLEIKNKEITSNTIIQLQKNELLNSIIEKLISVKQKLSQENHQIIDKIIVELQKSTDENTWGSFFMHFEKVHSSYFSNLSKLSKKLTLNEKRLCALISMKMTTKEIAIMTNISVRSVEMARYRLRKKFDISDPSISLNSFLENI